MHLHALGQDVCGRFVADLVEQWEDPARRADHRLLALNQLFDHVGSARYAFFFLDRGQARVGRVAAGGREAEGADAFGDLVDRQCQFGVLPFEHQVQGVEHRAGDVPVKIVGLQVQGVSVGEQAG
ncbi:hypothetical protein D3C80_1519960 [compost metagenome]